MLVQPFLPEIQSGGELSLLFFDGVFSHAVCKRPKAGDYRVQFQYGGTNEKVQVSDAARRAGAGLLGARAGPHGLRARRRRRQGRRVSS